jgi:hypothetical protein
MNIDPESYNLSIDTYKSIEAISNKILFTDSLLAEFMRDSKIEINIPSELSENYVKIISNIFAINLHKVALEVKQDIFDKGEKLSNETLKQIISVYYEKHLKTTRKQVLLFFNVKSEELKGRILLRAYTNMLPASDSNKLAYLNLITAKENIHLNLAKGIINQRLLNSQVPRNEIIDLATL